jgi:hypothetical protein
VSLYPDHFLSKILDIYQNQYNAGYASRAHYVREILDSTLDSLRKMGNPISMPRSYVQVPISVIMGCGAVSTAFFLIVIVGLSFIFARLPRWIPGMTAVLFAFAIGAVSALALGLYQYSMIVVYEVADEISKSLWSYPGLIIAVTVWTTLVFGVLGYGLANTLPNRPQRSIERAY